jgi:NADH:ubiquinone oxidoreductase subunit E
MAEASSVTVCDQPPSEAELLARLDQAIAEYRSVPGALIPLLQIGQGLFGYLPESALRRICAGLNKSYSEVAGVVSFYSFFSTTPRGRHTVRVCLGTACYVRGGKRVLESFRHTLGVEVGQTTGDHKFTLEVARCLGACGIAPACLVDTAVHQSIKPTNVPAILQKYA